MGAHEKIVTKTNDGVVIAAILGERKILLIKETTKPSPHYWKFVSETMLPGESILSALCRGIEEEAGLTLQARRTGETVVEITDPRLTNVCQLMPSELRERPLPHRRHFWGIKVSDNLIESLGGKFLQGDKNEHIETAAFDLFGLEGMVDFLPPHRELIQKLR